MNAKNPQDPQVSAAIQEFRKAEKWLFTLITDPQGERYFQEKSMEVRMQEFREQITRMQSFLDFCDNPETDYHSIHVAGTSGKGSVVHYLAACLKAAGVKVGYHVSPYLQVCNEKLISNGKMIRPSEFTALVTDFRARFEQWVDQNGLFETMKYGEAWVALTFLWMARQQVQWTVIETGLGGRYDPTNTIPAKLAVITNVNYDHVEVLGESLREIGYHKAGIIKHAGLAITSETKPEVLEVIQAEAHHKNARLFVLGQDFNYHKIEKSGKRLLRVEGVHRTYEDLALAMKGEFQIENAALAIASLDLLSGFGLLKVPEKAIRAGLQVEVPGRFEIIQQQPTVILDGAHNRHKAEALAASLSKQYPDKKMTVILGTLSIKDFSGIIHALAPITDKWIATQPKVFGKPTARAAALAAVIEEETPELEVVQSPDVKTAIQETLAGAKDDDLIVITGSLYLLGEARGLWVPVDQILAEIETQN
jgi:dihydrofolate synthase/folylpolyglutamate synthase